MKELSESKTKYSEDDIIKMLQILVDNIFVFCFVLFLFLFLFFFLGGGGGGGSTSRQSGTDCALF